MRTTSTSHPSQYELSGAMVDELTDQLFKRYEAAVTKALQSEHGVLCVVVEGLDPLANLARWLECEVFDELSGLNDQDLMMQEYADYEDRSMFVIALDVDSRSIAGMLRVVTGTAGVGPMVKSLRDVLNIVEYREAWLDLRENCPDFVRQHGIVGQADLDTGGLTRVELEKYHSIAPGSLIFDIAAVAVGPEHRRSASSSFEVSLSLYAATLRVGSILAASHFVFFGRTDLHRFLDERLDLNFEPVGGLEAAQYFEIDPFLSLPAIMDFQLQHKRAVDDYANDPEATGFRSRLISLWVGSEHSSRFQLG